MTTKYLMEKNPSTKNELQKLLNRFVFQFGRRDQIMFRIKSVYLSLRSRPVFTMGIFKKICGQGTAPGGQGVVLPLQRVGVSSREFRT